MGSANSCGNRVSTSQKTANDVRESTSQMANMKDELSTHAMSATHEVSKALESAQTDQEWHEAQVKVTHAKQIAAKLGKRGVEDMKSGELMLANAKNDIHEAMRRAKQADTDAATAKSMLMNAKIDEEAAIKLRRKGVDDKEVSEMMLDAVSKAECAFNEEESMRRQRREESKKQQDEELVRAETLRRMQRKKEAHELLKRHETGKNVSNAFKDAGQFMCGCD